MLCFSSILFSQTKPNIRVCGNEIPEILTPEQEKNRAKLEAFTAEYVKQKQQERKINSSNKTTTTIYIPVVFHIIYKSAYQNVSDAAINTLLNTLNSSIGATNADRLNTPSQYLPLVAGSDIQFCLAQRDPNGNATTGIERKQNNTQFTHASNNMKYTSMGGYDSWGMTNYLNVWICPFSSTVTTGVVVGYATFPGGQSALDGVVLHSQYLNGTSRRTIVHEVGHWLNLKHIWGSTNCGNDLVNDTPTQQTANFGCPTFPHITCSNNGDMSMNYMDYTDANCSYMFTRGQVDRMQACLNGARASLLTSSGCMPACPDIYEPNSTLALAVTVPVNTILYANIGSTTDKDVYRFYPYAQNIRVILTGLPNGFNFKLYGVTVLGANVPLITSYYTGISPQVLTLNGMTAFTSYKVLVESPAGQSSMGCYQIEFKKSNTPFRLMNPDNATDNQELEINEVSSDMLSVFPNPSNGVFTISGKEAMTLNIVNDLGQTVRAIELDETNNHNSEISNLSNGIYFIIGQSKEGTLVKQKLIVTQ